MTTSHPAELLRHLKQHDFLANYQMGLFCLSERQDSLLSAPWQMCAAPHDFPLCSSLCRPAVNEAVKNALAAGHPQVFRCPLGLLAFAVPLAPHQAPHCCIVGGGVREETIDLWRVEELSKQGNLNPFALLAQLEKIPFASEAEVARVAQRVRSLLPASQPEPHRQVSSERILERLDAIVGICADLDQAPGLDEVAGLFSEALGLLFDVPRIVLGIADRWGRSFQLRGTWGLHQDLGTLSSERLVRLCRGGADSRALLSAEEVGELLPAIPVARAIFFPFRVDRELLGMALLLDAELHPEEILLVELLVGRIAYKLSRLRVEEEHSRETSLSDRLMAMINKLAVIEEKEELYQNILEMGAELAQASCGSLMLTDDGRQELRIEATIRMNLHLARSLSVRVGSGIAGRVAESGHPLLVNDIEKDERVGEPNRPRFRTKSFISIPLKFKDTVLGVLNLSDKENNGIFTEGDMAALLSFVNPAAAMIHRATAMERSELLERLSVTDPLTELNNRRFLQKRMEEELNRSSRNKLPLTVIFIDLDHFKLYNDLCGHVGGDRALKRSAKILLAAVREMDLVARFGGEEFCVILPGTSKKESQFVAERIRRNIEQEPFPSGELLPLKRLTASLGIAAFPEDGTTVNALINAADMALYQAKAQGRNRICLAVSQQTPSLGHALPS